MTRRLPFALVALFVVVGLIAALAYAINAWQVFGFARHVWKLPVALCFGAAVVADALSLSGLFATYLLRSAPRKVRGYAWIVFLAMTGLSIAAAESFAVWRRLPPSEALGSQVAAGGIIVALALATHLLIIAKRHVAPTKTVDVSSAEAVAGVPVELTAETGAPGVYRAIGETPTPPLYIGSTSNLPNRIASHKAQSEWFSQVVKWVFEPYSSLDDARVAEVALVEAEQPVYNKRLRTGSRDYQRPMPPGAVVETVKPSVDVERVRTPRRLSRINPIPRKGGQVGPRPVSPERAEYVRRVLAGERAADVAREAGVSKRSVELWVKKARESEETGPEESAPAIAAVPTTAIPAKPQVNGHDIRTPSTEEVS